MSVTKRGLESVFDVAFAARLALREKQIQQSYRPVIGVHKWFARRPGTLFRSLLLAELGRGPIRETFWESHAIRGLIADPFLGGGTPVLEANRLGLDVVGSDVNPMAWWIVSQSLEPLDVRAFAREARRVVDDVARDLGALYQTRCLECGDDAPAKYVLWVKTVPCPACQRAVRLFPGHRLAEAVRHPAHVLVCGACGALEEHAVPPTRARPKPCRSCRAPITLEGNVLRRTATCGACAHAFSVARFDAPPASEPWAIEYHCPRCYDGRPGRMFKRPDAGDLARIADASRTLRAREASLPIPDDAIPPGDETARLFRWGYQRWRDLFGERQLLGLGLLLERIVAVEDRRVRHALATVFSDTTRYQNTLCRYDTYALKCQDIFSVHGFPVGWVHCENNLLGIEGVGSGSFVHFVEKHARAKAYCAAPFETRHEGAKKRVVPMAGEDIRAALVPSLAAPAGEKRALLVNAPSQTVELAPGTLDGVFTDPPYFDNVQYAELMDFCFAWLGRALGGEVRELARTSTRSADELTGNDTEGRGLEHFTAGLSEVFQRYASALKPGAPFVFTYHHNDPAAYVPLVVAILDAGLTCTATLPAAAEMTASLHIAKTASSILDSVFVCRAARDVKAPRPRSPRLLAQDAEAALEADAERLREAGLHPSEGDLRCLRAGHLARLAIGRLRPSWDAAAPLEVRRAAAHAAVDQLSAALALTTEAPEGRGRAARGTRTARRAPARSRRPRRRP